jgi:hypothetical protein
MMIATRPRAFERATAARTCEAYDISRASRGYSAIKPSIAPVHQPKAIDLPVIARSLDQPLVASTFETPEARQRRVKGELHLILQIEIGARQQREEGWHIGGKLTPQISFD